MIICMFYIIIICMLCYYHMHVLCYFFSLPVATCSAAGNDHMHVLVRQESDDQCMVSVNVNYSLILSSIQKKASREGEESAAIPAAG